MRLIKLKLTTLLVAGALAVLGALARDAGSAAQSSSVVPANMPRLGSIDERFESYNIEMVEVTGGNFWRPYASKAAPEKAAANHPTGVDASAF